MTSKITTESRPETPQETTTRLEKRAMDTARIEKELGELLQPLYHLVGPLREMAQTLGPSPRGLPCGILEEGLADGLFYFCKALDALGGAYAELATHVKDQAHDLVIAERQKKVGYRVRAGKAVRRGN